MSRDRHSDTLRHPGPYHVAHRCSAEVMEQSANVLGLDVLRPLLAAARALAACFKDDFAVTAQELPEASHDTSGLPGLAKVSNRLTVTMKHKTREHYCPIRPLRLAGSLPTLDDLFQI